MKKVARFVIAAILLAGIILILFGKEEVFCFLAPTERIDAPVLVIEGWVSEDALLQAAQEIQQSDYRQVFVTSIAHDSTFRMYSKGGLRFYLSNFQQREGRLFSFQNIQIQAFGRAAEGVQAHAKVMVDSIQVGEFTATDEPSWHTITLEKNTTADSITIVYDNDRRIGKEDRDLFVNSIRLDSLSIPARHSAVRYDRGKLDGNNVFRTDYQSIAEEAAEFLTKQGINPSMIQVLAAPPVSFERTYAAALTVKEHLTDTVQSVMLMSESVHTRRSWLVYQRMLGSSVNVGVIAASSSEEQPQDWWKERVSRNYVLLQLAKYLYVKLFFFPSSEDNTE